MPGLPGTGLGGVYYILLLIWIALREGWRTANRPVADSSRWERIAWLGALAVMMVSALALAGWVVRAVLGWSAPAGAGLEVTAFADAEMVVEGVTPAFASLLFVLLALLMLALHATRLVVGRRPKPQRIELGARDGNAAGDGRQARITAQRPLARAALDDGSSALAPPSPAATDSLAGDPEGAEEQALGFYGPRMIMAPGAGLPPAHPHG